VQVISRTHFGSFLWVSNFPFLSWTITQRLSKAKPVLQIFALSQEMPLHDLIGYTVKPLIAAITDG
jgi:hypothetical protein